MPNQDPSAPSDEQPPTEVPEPPARNRIHRPGGGERASTADPRRASSPPAPIFARPSSRPGSASPGTPSAPPTQTLIAEGLLPARPNRGVQLAVLDPDDLSTSLSSAGARGGGRRLVDPRRRGPRRRPPRRSTCSRPRRRRPLARRRRRRTCTFTAGSSTPPAPSGLARAYSSCAVGDPPLPGAAAAALRARGGGGGRARGADRGASQAARRRGPRSYFAQHLDEGADNLHPCAGEELTGEKVIE